jgi:hypothetical protein
MKTTAVLPHPRRLPARLLVVCLLATPGAQAASPQEMLVGETAKWVASQNEVPVDQVIVAPLDTRVAVQPCASQYIFDYPFINRESVRALYQGGIHASQSTGPGKYKTIHLTCSAEQYGTGTHIGSAGCAGIPDGAGGSE